MAQRLIDLTQQIYEGMVLWKGHPPAKIVVHATHEGTAALFDPPYSYTAETISLTTHAGTHTDSVSHVDPRPDAAAASADLRPGDVLLLYTGTYDRRLVATPARPAAPRW